MSKFEEAFWKTEKKYGGAFTWPFAALVGTTIGFICSLVFFVIVKFLSPWLLLVFPIAFLLAPVYMLYKVWNEEPS